MTLQYFTNRDDTKITEVTSYSSPSDPETGFAMIEEIFTSEGYYSYQRMATGGFSSNVADYTPDLVPSTQLLP